MPLPAGVPSSAPKNMYPRDIPASWVPLGLNTVPRNHPSEGKGGTPTGRRIVGRGLNFPSLLSGPEDLSPVGTSPSPPEWDPASTIPRRPLGQILAIVIPTRPQRQDPAISVTRTTARAAGQDPDTSVPSTTSRSSGEDPATVFSTTTRSAVQGRVSATSTKAGRDPIRIIRITRLKAEQDPAGIIQSTKPKAAGVTRLKAGREPGGPTRSKVL